MGAGPSSRSGNHPRTPEAAPPPAALRSPTFRLYLGGFGASLLADAVWFVGLGWAAGQLQDALATSVVMAAGSVPRALLLLFGGAIADRRGALAVTLRSQQLRLLVMVLVVVAATTVGMSTPALIVAAGVFGLLDALHMPAAAALPPQLLPAARLPEGQGLVQTLERLGLVAGAPLGGAAVAFGGFGACALVAAALLLVALAVLRRLPVPEGPAQDNATLDGHGGIIRDVGAGLRFAVRHPVIGPLLAVVTAINVGLSAPINVGVALLSAQQVWDGQAFGLIVGAFAAGAAAGALSVLWWRPALPARAGLLWVALGAVGVCVLGSCEKPGWAAAAAGAIGFTSGPASALLLGLVQALAPREQMGLVMSMVGLSALGVAPLAYVAFGVASGLLGLGWAFNLCAGVELAAVAVALSRSAVRNARMSAS